MLNQVSLVLNINTNNFIFKSAIFWRDSQNIIDYVKKNEDDLWQATNIRSLKTSGFETDIVYQF